MRRACLFFLPTVLFACGEQFQTLGQDPVDSGSPDGSPVGPDGSRVGDDGGARVSEGGGPGVGPDASTCTTSSPPSSPTQFVPLSNADEVVSLGFGGCGLYYSMLGGGIFGAGSGTPTNLVASLPGVAPGGTFGNAPLVFDAASVYFSYLTQSAAGLVNHVARAPLAGGPAVQLGSLMTTTDVQVVGVAVSGGFAYWSTQGNGTIYRAPVGGGAATTVVSGLSLPRGAPGAIVVHGDTLYTSDPAGDLLSVPVAGGAVTTLVTGVAPSAINIAGAGATGLAVDETSVYFTFCPFDASQPPAALMRIPLAGGTPTTLASSCAAGIAVDASNVYWLTADGPGGASVEEVAIAGGTPKVLASGLHAAVGPALDATSVYWGTAANTGTCIGCPPPANPGASAVWRAAK